MRNALATCTTERPHESALSVRSGSGPSFVVVIDLTAKATTRRARVTAAVPLPAPTLPRRLSPAAINRFRTCPKSFYFADIERVPRDERPSPILAQANAVHGALEKFFGLPQDDRSTENLHRALRHEWPKHRKPGSFHTRNEEAAYGRDALAMLSRFAEDFDTSARPLAREQWLTAPFEGIELFGKVDRIDARADGRLEIIDYKTGRRQLDPEDLPHDPAAQIYLLLAEAVYQAEVERVRFIYLVTGAEAAWSPEREDVEVLKTRLAALLTDMRATSEFTATPGDQCRWCPFSLRCPDRQRVALDDITPDPDLCF